MKIRLFYVISLILLVVLTTGITAAQLNTTPEVAVSPDALLPLDAGNQSIQPYAGFIDAGSPLYGLKLALENLDEFLTFNGTDRLQKQLDHAELRLSETLHEIQLNRSDAANISLKRYMDKINSTDNTLDHVGNKTTGLLNAEQEIQKHQAVLGNLLLSHPNNTGLLRAYNNSISLEEKFSDKINPDQTPGVNGENQTASSPVENQPTEDLHSSAHPARPTETSETPTVTGPQQEKGGNNRGINKDENTNPGRGNPHGQDGK